VIYRRHDPPPLPKPRRQPAQVVSAIPKAVVFTRQVIRHQVESQLADLRRPGQPQRSEEEVWIILNWLEQSGTLDQWNCHAACERLAKSLLSVEDAGN